MLHMIVATHSPEACPINVPDNMKKTLTANQQMTEVTKKLGVTISDAWVDGIAHTIFFLIEAPNAHVISQLMTELHYFDWNTITVHPVSKLQESLARYAQRK